VAAGMRARKINPIRDGEERHSARTFRPQIDERFLQGRIAVILGGYAANYLRVRGVSTTVQQASLMRRDPLWP
jgi:hypothetical protein